MNKLKRQLVSVLATGALVLNLVTPVAAQTTIEISGNGTGSDNDATVTLSSSTSVAQFNEADVKNDVDASADTGGNDAKDNTGGSVSIETGDASTEVSVSNMANANWASVGGGSDGGGSVSLRILGNGTHSDNDIVLELARSLSVAQFNDADIKNDVDASADTGDNDAEDNTGGTVSIETGDAEVTVEVDNMANFNWADVDCGCLLEVLAKIAGNGSDSDNTIKAKLSDETKIFQDNVWDCKGKKGPHDADSEGWWWWHKKPCNDVDASADTGDNDVKDNTGDPGVDPSIETGDAETIVEVSNAGNSNVFGDDVPGDWPEFEFNFNISLSWAQLLALLGLSE